MMSDSDNLAEQLSAYVHGELDDKERAAVQQLLREDPTARAELERLRETATRVRDRTRVAKPTRNGMTATERDDLIGDTSQPTTAASSPWRQFRSLLLTVATIGLTVGVGLWGLSLSVPKEESQPVTQIEKPLPAQPPETVHEEAGETRPALARHDTLPSPPEPAVVEEATLSVTMRDTAPPLQDIEQENRSPVDNLDTNGDAPSLANTADRYSPPPPSDFELEIVCADESDLDWCTERLDRFIGVRDPRGTDMVKYALELLFHFGDARDAPPSDTSHNVERQTKLPATELQRLVAVFDAGPSARREIRLTVGTLLQAAGWSQTQAVIAMLPGVTTGVTQAATDSVEQEAERFITVTIRLRAPEHLPKPIGEPGALVPRLTENHE